MGAAAPAAQVSGHVHQLPHRDFRHTTPRSVDTREANRQPQCELTNLERRNEVTMRRIYTEIFDQGRLELIEELMAPDAVNHTAPEGFQHGTDPVRGLVTMLRTAFPDCATVIEETLPAGDTVVMRNWFQGTHQGMFLGHEPTGRRFRFRQIHWVRFGPDDASSNTGAYATTSRTSNNWA
jgi:predicted ester cyclase